jgi:hypothetical protein
MRLRSVLALVLLTSMSVTVSACRKKGGGDGGGGGSKKCAPAATVAEGEEGAAEGEAPAAASLAEEDCEVEGGETSSETPASGDDGDDTSTGYTKKDGHGCLQGVITDAYTGQRLDISALADPAGVYVLIRNKKLKAQTHTGDANLVGEYFICDIPVEETYPVYAYIDGYLPFESTVNIDSTRALRTSNEGAYTEEVKIADPMELTDIRLFPKGNTGRDLLVRVTNEGKPVKDAIVDLEAQAAVGHFAFSGTFATSANTRILPMRKITDADGLAKFEAADLSLGANYSLKVTANGKSDLSTGTRTLVLGVSGTTVDDEDNWEFNFELGDTNQALRVISCSNKNESFNATGTIQIVFNRDVALSFNDDAWVTTLGGAATGALPADVANNGASERVTALIADGHTLVLKPKFTGGTALETPDYSVAKADPANVDIDATITYTANTYELAVVGDSTQNAVLLSSVSNLAAMCGANPSIRFFKEY